MAKTSNFLSSKIVRVSSNAIVEYYLEKLVETGLYGNNTTEAAGVLLSREIERLVSEGAIPRAPKNIQAQARKNPSPDG